MNPEKNEPKKEPEGLAVVVSVHGEATVLIWQGTSAIEDFVSDTTKINDTGFSLADIEHDTPDNGVFIARITIASFGLSDWADGSLEYGLKLEGARPITKDEWAAYCREEWPWEPYDEQEPS